MENYYFMDTDGNPIFSTHDSEIIKELSERVEQLEYNLERTNKQLLELTERHDYVVKLLMRWRWITAKELFEKDDDEDEKSA